MAEPRQPHWVVVLILGALLALLLTWLGLNDWRFPFVTTAPSSSSPASSTTHSAGLTGPIQITKMSGGAVDIRWSVVANPELRGYDVTVTAVRPVKYEYGVPRYAGDSDVTERHYPAEYLNKALAEAKDPRRVESGQVWYVCVQGMRETPLNVPIDPYIIPGTKACSDEFATP